MNTTNTNSTARRITAAALMAVAAGALAVGAAGTANAKPSITNPAPPAQPSQSRAPETAPRYGAIFLSSNGAWGSFGGAASHPAANAAAMAQCAAAGGVDCFLTGTAVDECLALAVDAIDFAQWGIGVGPTKVTSQTAALQQNGGGRIATVACTVNNSPHGLGRSGRVNEMPY